jgi:hypothetical protein
MEISQGKILGKSGICADSTAISIIFGRSLQKLLVSSNMNGKLAAYRDRL